MKSLSKKDREILAEVELDAERSSQSVAKALRMQPYSVQHALRRLREKGVIAPKPFIDISRLGRLDVAVYFSVAFPQSRALTNFLRRVEASPRTAFLQTLAGDFQFVSVLHCNRLSEVQTYLKELSEWSQGAIVSKAVIPRTNYRQYRRKYLTKPRAQEVALSALGAAEVASVSEEELEILAQLAYGKATSIRQLARELKQPYSTVDYRYKQLTQKQIICGWFFDIQEEALEVQRFKLLIACHQISKDSEAGLEKFARAHPSLTYLLQTLGSWDFELGVECGQPQELMEVVALLHEAFPRAISSIRSLTELRTLKFTMFPERLNKKHSGDGLSA